VSDGRLRRPRPLVTALEAVERLLVEDAGHQAEPLVEREFDPIADRDAGRFLPAVLERVETDVGQPRDRPARRPDADHAALLARAVGLVDG
jgi:hypothetical protein